MSEETIGVSTDVSIVKIPAGKIHPNDWNPNELSDAMFNRLVGDVQTLGFLQPILVTPLDDGTYRIVDGEHRFECAKLMDMAEIPCVVVAGDFAEDETRQKLQTMRMNMIRGSVNKRKLTSLVEDLATSMPLEDVAEGMAYDDVDGLRALIDDARKDMPPEMRKEFDKAKEEIKTVDDLSLVLNRLFTKYGSTLPWHYMIMDFGGKEHIWVRLRDKKALSTVKACAELAREHNVTLSSLVLHTLTACLAQDYMAEHRDSLEEAENEDKQENTAQGAAAAS